ncbi:MAG: IS1634 family transposase [Actinomycetota bacterium]|nr:IS1634 family transposase [Actinomycetota bacterium]
MVEVDPDKLQVEAVGIGALPVVNAVLSRLGFDELLGDYLPEPDPRCAIAPARAIGVLVRNLAVCRRPLYALGVWAERYDPAALGLSGGQAGRLNDDRVGRALDELFLADRSSLMTALSLRVIRRFGVEVKELHNDSTSITLYGAYRSADGTPRAGVRPPVPEHGFSKDHRGDLLQLVDILTIASDGAVPMANRLADGSTEDSTTHEETWDQLVCMLGHSNFCYVADCKLATRDNMDHIARRGGRFLTILPRTRKEDAAGRAWIARGGASWVEIARKPGKRKHDPDEVYWAAEAPSPSAEGYRIVWIRSSDKRARDAESRRQRIERALCALRSLEEDLASARSRLKSLAAVEDTAAVTTKEAGASRWVRAKVTDTVTYEHRQEKRGRPGKSTRYRRIEHHRFSVASEVDQEAVAYDAASDGCFPFVTNETLPPAELLRIYKFQPRLERRHATFKGVIEAAPLTLKSDTRLDALGFCLYVAPLVCRSPRHSLYDGLVGPYDVLGTLYDDCMDAIRAKVTRNGQVSLPAELRRRWAAGSVLVIDRGDYAIVRPIPTDPLASLRGSHAGPGPALEQARAAERATEREREEQSSRR